MDRFIVIQFRDIDHFVGIFDRERQRTVWSRRITEYDAHGKARREAFHRNAIAAGYVKEERR